MDAKELRLGNYVTTNISRERGSAFQIKHINTEKNLVSDNLLFWYKLEDVKPIKLTEEKLLELGFKKSYPAGWYDKNGIEIFNSNMKTGAYDYYFSSKTLTVMYVHELQNLYSLTGEELTINK